jgi:hypothetical protein
MHDEADTVQCGQLTCCVRSVVSETSAHREAGDVIVGQIDAGCSVDRLDSTPCGRRGEKAGGE